MEPLWGQVLIRLGACEIMLGDLQRGEQHVHAGLQHATNDVERVLALSHLAHSAGDQGDMSLFRALLGESLAISQGNNDMAGMAQALGGLPFGSSDYPESCRQCSESLALWRKVGRPDRIAGMLTNLAWYTWCAGDYAAADAYWREGLALCEQLDLPSLKAWTLDCLGNAAWVESDWAFSEQCIRAALAIYAELGMQTATGMCKADLSYALAGAGQTEQALALAQEAVVLTRATHSQMMLTLSLNYLGAALLAAGDLAAARSALMEAIRQAWEQGFVYNLMTAFYFSAELLVLETPSLERPGALERQALAVTVLSFVRSQAATWQYFKDKAAHLQMEIESALSAELGAAAIVRGQSCTPAEMVGALLGVLDAG